METFCVPVHAQDALKPEAAVVRLAVKRQLGMQTLAARSLTNGLLCSTDHVRNVLTCHACHASSSRVASVSMTRRCRSSATGSAVFIT